MDDRKCLTVIRCFYLALCPALTICNFIFQGTISEPNWDIMTVYLFFLAFLWIPWKYDWLAVRIAITFLGTLVSFGMIDEIWQAIHYPSRFVQLQVMSLSAYILEGVLIAFSFVVPAVLVWFRFRYRVWVLSGAFLFWLCYICYLHISAILTWY